MKKIIFGIAVSLTIISCLIIKDPLQMFFNFLVGGVVPGLNISLGFLPSLSFIVFVTWMIKLWLASIQSQMIIKSASLNKLENEAQEFATKNNGVVSKKLSIVIAPEAK